MYRRINPAVGLIAALHGEAGFFACANALRHTHSGVTRFIDTLPATRAHTSKNRRAVRCALFRLQDFDFVRVNIGLDLLPERGASASAAEADAFNGNVNFVEDCEGVFQAVGDAFEDGADEVRAGMRGGEADKSGAREWIQMRSALAHQIRRPERTFGTGGNGGCLSGH